MFWNFNRNILLDITTDFGCALLGYKAAKAPDVDILAVCETFLYLFEHGFQRHKHINFRNTRFVRDLIDEIRLAHSRVFLFTVSDQDTT